MDQNGIKARLMEALRQYASLDLRFSYLALGGTIVVGGLINLLFAHGWTVWPAILAFGILTYMNEAVSRNCQGFPPYHVYAFFFGAIAVWTLIVLILSAVNPVILLLGIGAILFRIIEAILRQRQREQLIATRRLQGVCLHCGGPYDSNVVFCENCGEEPNPDEAILKRVAQIYRSNDQIERARSALVRTAAPTTASSKEQALLARHRTGKVTPASQLPKAAKLGPSRSAKRPG
jgi:hypothetical protein